MDFYSKKPSKNPYGNNRLISGEPDIRKEIKKLLFTEERGSYYIYRRVRRDSQGYPIAASSTLENRSGEATFGTNKGMKYLFDDYMVTAYLSEGSNFHEPGKVKEYGDSRSDALILYLEHDVLFKHTSNLKDMPDEFDKIIEPEIDINGTVSSPLAIRVKYDIGSSEPYRLDKFGRVEFFKINLISNFDNSIRL